jgi:hypothetical protein
MRILDLPCDVLIMIFDAVLHEADVLRFGSTCKVLLPYVTSTRIQTTFANRFQRQMLRRPLDRMPLAKKALKIAMRRNYTIAMNQIVLKFDGKQRETLLGSMVACCMDPHYWQGPEHATERLLFLINLGATYDSTLILFSIKRDLFPLFVFAFSRLNSRPDRTTLEHYILRHDRFRFLEYLHEQGFYRWLNGPCRFDTELGHDVRSGLLRRLKEGRDEGEYLRGNEQARGVRALSFYMSDVEWWNGIHVPARVPESGPPVGESA